jgi:hypothetical protein
MVRRTMRACLWTQAATLGVIGVYVLWAHVRHRTEDLLTQALFFSTALLWPSVFHLLLVPTYFRSEKAASNGAGGTGAGARVGPLALSVALYLPLMVFLSSSKDMWKSLPTPAPLFLVLWILTACLFRWLRIGRLNDTGIHPGPLRGLDRWLELTARAFRPEIVILLGLVLLAISLREQYEIDLLDGRAMWITAEVGLGDRISAARVVLKYLGRLVYGGSLLVSAGTVVWLAVARLLRGLTALRLAVGLGITAGFLAICAITDFYISWLSFMLNGRLPNLDWVLFGLFFLNWAAPLCLVAMTARARRFREQAQQVVQAIVMYYAPLLLLDLAMSPFFVEKGGVAFEVFPFILAAFLGLQLLSWGYVRLALD